MRKKDTTAMTVKDAGRKGGLRTAETHGHQFYEDIGRKGGAKGGPKVRELIEAARKSQND